MLGCTHYPLLMDAVQSLVPDLKIISSSYEAALSLKTSLERMKQLNEGPGSRTRFYVSDDAEAFRENASVFLNYKLGDEVEQVSV